VPQATMLLLSLCGWSMALSHMQLGKVANPYLNNLDNILIALLLNILL